MKINLIFVLFLSIASYAEQNKFKDLNASPEASQKMKTVSPYNSSLVVVQKRVVNRFRLSEFFVGFSPIISGSLYSYSGSFDGAYQFHFNPRFSTGFKYSYFLHRTNREGEEMLTRFRRVPLLLKYAPKQSYQWQTYWYPFYGKLALQRTVIHFDLYSVFSMILQEVNETDKLIPSGSLGLGFAIWWNKHLNSRMELSGQYYKYSIDNVVQHSVYTYLSLSVGLLF